jgi:multiple sugar transport system permease protein
MRSSPLRRTFDVLAMFVVAIWLFPIYWVLLTSVKPPQVINSPVPIFAFNPTLENYRELFGRFEFGRILANSLVIVSISTIITMILAVMAAYALARLNMRSASGLSLFILSFRFMPAMVVVLPYYLIFQRFSLTDTYVGMILIYVAFGLPFAVWLLRGFLLDLPRDIEDAARLDGLKPWAVARRVMLPLARPGIAVTTIFTFVFGWNEYLFALMLTYVQAVTVPVALSKMVEPYVVLWGDISGAVTIQLVPMLIVVFLLQRHITRGLALGAVK